jgi:diguanylate cyclase (GGDEF)-like protein
VRARAEGGVSAPEVQSVLVIDDSPEIHDLIDVRLKAEGVQVHHALDAETGLTAMREVRPDLVLLDLDLPGRDGIDVCREIKHDPELAASVVIFLTGTVDVDAKVRAFDVGAVDYVTKPFDAVELRARVRAALRTKRYHDLLATRAQIDALTGLWNRAHFDEVLAEELSLWSRERRPVALIMLDIDHFKRLNDTHGHPFGDLVLRRISDAIALGLRQSEKAFRYGGEEFAVVLRGCGRAGAEVAAERLRAHIEGLEIAQGSTIVPVTASLGVASVDATATGTISANADLIAAADRALYEAKRAGRNRVSAA